MNDVNEISFAFTEGSDEGPRPVKARRPYLLVRNPFHTRRQAMEARRRRQRTRIADRPWMRGGNTFTVEDGVLKFRGIPVQVRDE